MLNGSNSIGAAISESISVSVVKRFLYESCIIDLVSSESLFCLANLESELFKGIQVAIGHFQCVLRVSYCIGFNCLNR